MLAIYNIFLIQGIGVYVLGQEDDFGTTLEIRSRGMEEREYANNRT